jgi:hypothetical protein
MKMKKGGQVQKLAEVSTYANTFPADIKISLRTTPTVIELNVFHLYFSELANYSN